MCQCRISHDGHVAKGVIHRIGFEIVHARFEKQVAGNAAPLSSLGWTLIGRQSVTHHDGLRGKNVLKQSTEMRVALQRTVVQGDNDIAIVGRGERPGPRDAGVYRAVGSGCPRCAELDNDSEPGHSE